MIHLNVGSNWNPKLLSVAQEINSRSEGIRISEFYGSLREQVVGSARPDARLSVTTWSEFRDFCKQAHKRDIKINYTLNTYCLGDLHKLTDAYMNKVRPFIKRLAKYVDVITVAHPIVMEWVLDFSEVDVAISTILEVADLPTLQFYAQHNDRIKKVCLSIHANYDEKLLKAARKASNQIPTIELLANEFCNVGGFPCRSIYRPSCYMGHSHNCFLAYDNYPMSRCTVSRWKNPASWLKAFFILPQWMEFYNSEFGINHFKVTGRTHAVDFIYWIMRTYASKNYTGNVLALWAQLECIWKGFEEQAYILKRVEIPATHVDKSGFLEHRLRNSCQYQVCGQTCSFCDRLARELAQLSEGSVEDDAD